MANVSVEDGRIKVKLSFLKKLGALSGDLSVPLELVETVTVEPNLTWNNSGLRMGGTGIPGVIALGRFWKPGLSSFVDWKSGEQVVIINLKNYSYSRLVLGTKNPDEILSALGVKARV